MESIGALEVAWLAGLLEGEGCFVLQRPSKRVASKYPNARPWLVVRLEMTDEDVIQRAHSLIQPKLAKVHRSKKRGSLQNDTFTFGISGQEAEDVMRAVRPFMGKRRGAKIDHLLSLEDLAHHSRAL